MNLTDEVLTELETKAKAALESLPAEYRDQRWNVELDTPMPLGVEIPRAGGGSSFCVVEEDGVSTSQPALMLHVAAADPHAVLALVAEVRRLRTQVERRGLAGQRVASVCFNLIQRTTGTVLTENDKAHLHAVLQKWDAEVGP